jgi:hypothetical protein
MQNVKGSVVLILIIIILVSAVAGLGYVVIKGQPTKEIANPTEISTTASPTPSPTLTTAPTVAEKPVVVFEAEGSFTQAEKDEIYKKVINPYLDYYSMELPDQILLTITIAKNLTDNKDIYPYSVSTIFKSGGHAGFMVTKEGTGIAWWLPECMDGCKLSAAYKAKYPEIASKVQ